MKVTSTNQASFSPIELKITIEIQEELTLLQVLLGCNLCIPEFLVDEKVINADREKLLSKLMGELYDTLKAK